jgi:hypothetical protein
MSKENLSRLANFFQEGGKVKEFFDAVLDRMAAAANKLNIDSYQIRKAIEFDSDKNDEDYNLISRDETLICTLANRTIEILVPKLEEEIGEMLRLTIEDSVKVGLMEAQSLDRGGEEGDLDYQKICFDISRLR